MSEDDDTPRRPARPVRSQLHGARGFLAPWYRLLFPMPPRTVRDLRPSEVASILGLDRTDAVVVVPLPDEAWHDTADTEIAPIPQAGQRLVRVVSRDG